MLCGPRPTGNVPNTVPVELNSVTLLESLFATHRLPDESMAMLCGPLPTVNGPLGAPVPPLNSVT